MPAPREHRQPSQPRKRRPEHLASWRKGPREPPRLGGPPLCTFHPASRCSGGSARVGEGCRRATKTSGRPSAQKQGRKTSARGRRGWTGRRGRCLRRLAGTPQPQKNQKRQACKSRLERSALRTGLLNPHNSLPAAQTATKPSNSTLSWRWRSPHAGVTLHGHPPGPFESL